MAELATSAPLVAAGRLQRVSSMSAAMAWREWSAWGMEKMFAWQLLVPRMWMAAVTGTRPSMATAMRVLKPVAARVKRNARRKRR